MSGRHSALISREELWRYGGGGCDSGCDVGQEAGTGFGLERMTVAVVKVGLLFRFLETRNQKGLVAVAVVVLFLDWGWEVKGCRHGVGA